MGLLGRHSEAQPLKSSSDPMRHHFLHHSKHLLMAEKDTTQHTCATSRSPLSVCSQFDAHKPLWVELLSFY